MKNGRFYSIKNRREEWYRNGLLHREGSPAIIWDDGREEWYKDGFLHREGRPAILNTDGYEAWFKHGRLHREDGPARIWPNGYKEWWLNDIQLSKEKWWARLPDDMKLKAIFDEKNFIIDTKNS
jgi:hypothetical protein